MLTQNCKCVLDKLLEKNTNDPFRMYCMGEISSISGLAFQETIAACKQLESLGYMEIFYVTLNGSAVIDTLRITELGAHYKEDRRRKIGEYIANNWISFLALVVAIISLIISMRA